ncbi:hypothetical protein Tco_0123871 [Tanacetum coccineum]
MERFKAESMHVSRAPECMRISGFMHGITNLDLIKKLNDNIPKFVEEMMSVTTSFLRGKVAVANQSKKKVSPAWKHHETSRRPNFDKRLDFKSQHKSSRRQDRFTPLTKTLKEIMAMETVKFKAPPPMIGPAENRNKNKFYEFHRDKGHNTDECIHPRKQIEEAVKSGQLSHLVKEIRQRGKRGEQTKTAKKEEAPNKEKAMAIFMVQPWQRITRNNDGQETLIMIEAEVEGHLILRMYVDGGSALEVLYEHSFNKLYPKINKLNYPSNDPSPRIQRRNILAVGENITNGDSRRWRALNERPDELYGRQIPVTIQRYHRPPKSQKNPSGPIYCSRNAKIPSGRRNSDNLQQHHNTSEMQNGGRNTKFPSTKRTSGHRRNQSSNPPRVSGANRHDRRKLIQKGRMELYNLLKDNLDIFS